MEFHEFRATEWASMKVPERVARCHVMSKEARILAEGASPIEFAAYRALASAWLELATAISRAETF